MARLSDIPKVLRSVGPLTFARRVLDETFNDQLFTWAAALAYAWLFAIFPFMIFLLALLPHLPEYAKQSALGEIHELIVQLFPSGAASIIWSNIQENRDLSTFLNQPQGKLLYVGLAVAVWSASGGMAMTMSALDRCYELQRGRPFLWHRTLAVLLTIVVALLLLLVICLLPVGGFVKHWIMHRQLAPKAALILFDVARWSLSVLIMFALLSLIYYVGPAVKHHFRWVTPGALFSVVVWVLLAVAFRQYVERMGAKGYQRTYGTVGGVAILLLFFYIDAVVLLIGAEINSEIDFEVLKIKRGTRDFRFAEDATVPAPTAM